MSTQLCDNCHRRAALRRYCRVCSPLASAIYKRKDRLEDKAAGRQYWLAWWKKSFGDAAAAMRNEYQKAYMKRYRRSRRVRATA